MKDMTLGRLKRPMRKESAVRPKERTDTRMRPFMLLPETAFPRVWEAAMPAIRAIRENTWTNRGFISLLSRAQAVSFTYNPKKTA
jgi:hypothetical protein